MACVQAFEEPSNRGAASATVLDIDAVQRLADVLVAKAPGDVIVVQNGAEETEIVVTRRIEAGEATAGDGLRLGQLTQLLVCRSWVVDHGQGFEVAAVASECLHLVVDQTTRVLVHGEVT